jgi:hypothetical protein
MILAPDSEGDNKNWYLAFQVVNEEFCGNHCCQFAGKGFDQRGNVKLNPDESRSKKFTFTRTRGSENSVILICSIFSLNKRCKNSENSM